MAQVTCLEICAGAGGQSLGLERAGFAPQALVEIDGHCCDTLTVIHTLTVIQLSRFKPRHASLSIALI
jgi:site-specific DNA-cytosine methylase